MTALPWRNEGWRSAERLLCAQFSDRQSMHNFHLLTLLLILRGSKDDDGETEAAQKR